MIYLGIWIWLIPDWKNKIHHWFGLDTGHSGLDTVTSKSPTTNQISTHLFFQKGQTLQSKSDKWEFPRVAKISMRKNRQRQQPQKTGTTKNIVNEGGNCRE
jgi:hypothetical protein